MKIVPFLLLVFQIINSGAQERLNYFLPTDVVYNEKIPTPETFFQQQMGEWHLTHDQVFSYIKEIAQVSNRAIVQEYARSYENRILGHLIFTSEKNQGRLDELKELHVKFSDPHEDIPINNVPLVVTLSYGVHGNESSATNSAVLTAYYLAAAEGKKMEQLLENTIILVDPCMNPDGFTRHSTWANMHQSATSMVSPDSRQFREVWPGGRTNHYWFDLNRDYLLLVHPESRGRVSKFHEWKPNIFTDHHEMGANSTFFFQPGVPSRNNPLTPEDNYRLTHKIARYHARFLDEIGSAYYSEEQFDDYYFGKGSSYPDVNAGVGILFEQAGYRGRIRETSNGIKTLSFGIKNQFTVTLSTLQAAMDLKNELLRFQKNFYLEALQSAEKDPVKAYLFGSENKRQLSNMFINLLGQHQIEVYNNEKEVTIHGKTFNPGSSFVVPSYQKQFHLIKSIFEEVTSFEDSTFYDVSTWTLPYAFNLPFARVQSLKQVQMSGKEAEPKPLKGKVTGGKSRLGYLFRWNEYASPKALFKLQKEEIRTKVATDTFSFPFNGKQENFDYGTILIPVNTQKIDEDAVFQKIYDIAQSTGIDFYGLETGLSPNGIDIGSNSFAPLEKPEALMLVGNGISSRDAGEIWHLFDQRYQIPVCLAESSQLGSIDLNRYNVLILPPGSYRELNQGEIEKMKRWAEQGGTLVAVKSAAAWASRNELGKTRFKNNSRPDSTSRFNFATRNKEHTLSAISGAIFKTEIDNTHPICYGYLKKELPIFKTGTSVAEPLESRYAEPVHFSDSPYISGYVSPTNVKRIQNAPVVSVQAIGRGNLISYHENMTFRGIWMGTNKLFVNSVFFGGIIR